MNKRIKELKIQACKWASENVPATEYENASDEKFAELIVKETMQVVANNVASNAYLDVAKAVIEHFEVNK